jgi:hypothetical protein
MCGRTERAVAEILNTTRERTDCGFLWGLWVLRGDYCGVGGVYPAVFGVRNGYLGGCTGVVWGTLNLPENCWFDMTDNLWKTMHKKCA